MEPMKLGMANGSSLDGSQIDTYNGVYYTLGFTFPRLLNAVADPFPRPSPAYPQEFFFQAHRQANRERRHGLAWVLRRPMRRPLLFRPAHWLRGPSHAHSCGSTRMESSVPSGIGT